MSAKQEQWSLFTHVREQQQPVSYRWVRVQSGHAHNGTVDEMFGATATVRTTMLYLLAFFLSKSKYR